jgi:hypothetical protein
MEKKGIHDTFDYLLFGLLENEAHSYCLQRKYTKSNKATNKY